MHLPVHTSGVKPPGRGDNWCLEFTPSAGAGDLRIQFRCLDSQSRYLELLLLSLMMAWLTADHS